MIRVNPLTLTFAAIFVAALGILIPGQAWAYTLQCNQGAVAGGDMFIGVGDCSLFTYTQPFSALNCYFQHILNSVISRMYCGIQYQFSFYLKAIFALFVIFYAIMFMLGLAALTTKELTTRLIKMALIWAFATNASWGIGLAFYFFSGGIETMVNWVVQVFYPNQTGLSFIGYIDFLIHQRLTQGLTVSGMAVIGFFIVMAGLVFPLFLLFLTFMLMLISLLTRTVVTYLLGLTAIAFLLSLGPIFVSLALFKSTYTFFDSWIRYLISFSLQIVFVFATVALWLYVMNMAGDFIGELGKMIVPFKDNTQSQAAFAFFRNSWGVCYNGYVQAVNTVGDTIWLCRTGTPISSYCEYTYYVSGGTGTALECGLNRPVAPAAYASNETFINWISINLIVLGTLMYTFDALLRNMPDLARQLAGPALAPQLGGGYGFGAIQMPGFSALGQAKEQMLFQAKSQLLGRFTSYQADMSQRHQSKADAAPQPADTRSKAEQGRDTVGGLVGPR